MSSKVVVVDALSGDRFVARNPRGDRVTLEAHHEPPLETDPASVGLGPMEALLAALGSCSAVDVADIMRKRRTPLSRYRVEVEGERADGTPGRYTRISMRHVASGEGVTEATLEKAARLSLERYCSVAASLDPAIEISLSAVVEPGGTEAFAPA